MRPLRISPTFLCLAISVVVLRAEVRLHNLFTDHMVLQRGTRVPIWGWADDGEQVRVEFQGQTVSTRARNGRWQVILKDLKPGPAESLKVFGTRTGGDDAHDDYTTIQINDVLVGEVWIASGQSNMEWPLSRSFEPTNDIQQSANANIRLFTVPKLKLGAPTNNVNSRWRECGPDTVPAFSAVAYYFARDLQKALGVPVGVIHTSWGGSPAEVWMRHEVLADDKEFKRDILEPFTEQHQRFTNSVADWERARAAAIRAGTNFTRPRPSLWRSSELYNGMIAPLLPYAIQGAIWYQGESNAGRAWQYRRLFPAMIENWRDDWDREFTFLEVQLAPWDKNRRRSIDEITARPVASDWAELREAQWLTARKLDKVGMAVITDVGDKDDIHPTKKEPVGARLALLARKIAYREDIVAEGPVFDGVKFSRGKAFLGFKNVGGGLVAHGERLTGFAVAGPDRSFVWADAVIDGDKVIVSSPEVAQPKAVRYGWADFPVVNLFNKEGLPATPFRTDDWPAITAPKKTKVVKSEFIYEQAPFPSCHASTIAETKSGLIAAWFGGSDEGNNDVAIWTAQRAGAKWSAPVEVATGVQTGGQRYPCWNPVLFQYPNGPLLLFYKVGPSPSRWWGMVIRSEDSGKTWSKPERLPDNILGPIKNKPVLIEDELWCPSSTEDNGWRIHMEFATDAGRRWRRTEALNSADAFGAIQPTILEWPRNQVQLLNRSKQGKITETWTKDGGKTFSPMRATLLNNPNSGIDAVMLRDGRALLVYNNTLRGRTPLTVATSTDGEVWTNVLTLEDEPGEYSYPAVIQTRDGRVHVTYTWKRQRIRHVEVKP
jgi:sialate O-acetylesterase